MNPTLSKNIAELQAKARYSAEIIPATDEEVMLVNGLVKNIAEFKLGKKVDKYGDRACLLECNNQSDLVDGLYPSDDQRLFLGQVTLKLQVKTVLEEGPKARTIDLLCFNEPDQQFPSGHLFRALALSAADTSDNIAKLYTSGVIVPVLPGMPEFEDIKLLVESFKQ